METPTFFFIYSTLSVAYTNGFQITFLERLEFLTRNWVISWTLNIGQPSQLNVVQKETYRPSPVSLAEIIVEKAP